MFIWSSWAFTPMIAPNKIGKLKKTIDLKTMFTELPILDTCLLIHLIVNVSSAKVETEAVKPVIIIAQIPVT